MQKEQRVNIRISKRAYLELKKRSKKTDSTIISVLNTMCGV